MKYILILATAIAITLCAGHVALADSSLRLRPLEYRQTLSKGAKEKGFIDVTNPSASTANVDFSVRGFRQVNSHGDLDFYTSDQLSQGILLDYSNTTIPAGKTLRLYFIIDGTKLPTGDVFAAIFAQTKAIEGTGAAPSVRLGSLLILTNQAPGARQAQITEFRLPWLQIGTSINGELAIKNTAPANSASGFFPKVHVSLWPFGPTKDVEGPLIFAGITRHMSFNIPDNQLGVYQISTDIGSSRVSRWVVVITGIWRWITIGVVILILVFILGLYWYRHKRHLRRR